MEPTAEQQAVIGAASRRATFKVAAFAGTGKTTTLEMVASRALPHKRALYVAFNKSVRVHAQTLFPRNVECRTANSIGYQYAGPTYGHRLAEGSVQWQRELLRRYPRMLRELAVAGARRMDQAVAALSQTLRAFMLSEATDVGPEHVSPILQALVPPAQHEKWVNALVVAAQGIWSEMKRPESSMPVDHAFILKMAFLGGPILPADTILFDESQDADPVMAALIQQQPAQRIFVGDQHQSIYTWRGAINAMESIALPELPLTESWRFGPNIASVASFILASLKGEQRELIGRAPEAGEVLDDPADTRQRTILARTNAAMLEEALALLEQGKTVALPAGDNTLDLESAYSLFVGGVGKGKLAPFASWEELSAFAASDVGGEYRPLVRMVERHGAAIPNIVHLLERASVGEERADRVLYTIHKAKGRQWPEVRLLDDFLPLVDYDDRTAGPQLRVEEVNLVYVAATRAQRVLNMGGSLRRVEDAATLMSSATGVG